MYTQIDKLCFHVKIIYRFHSLPSSKAQLGQVKLSVYVEMLA